MKIRFAPQLLSLAIGAALSPNAWAADPAGQERPPVKLDRTEVTAEVPADPRFPQIAKEIENGLVKTGKKSTVVVLNEQPAVVNNELRQTFSRVPGLLISEQQIAGHFNINYRGLGDPHESEFVSFFENGVPLASDWFGYPTMYYLPPIDRIERIAFVRGGSALLYGPQPGPSVDFITRRAEPNRDVSLRSRHSGGEDGLYATYNEISGGSENFGWMASYDHRQYDGNRRNADVDVDGASVSFYWQQNEDANWRFDYYSYDSENGEPGRLPSNVYETQPEWTSTPFNRLWIERDSAILSHQRRFNDSTVLDAKLWHTKQDRFSYRTGRFLPNQLAVNITFSSERQEFANSGLDARLTSDWGDNHTLTYGLTTFYNDTPRSQLNVAQDGIVSPTQYFQQRNSRYNALFAENVFRFERLSLIPAARFEWFELDVNELETLRGLSRDPIDRSFKQNVPLLGIGATYEWPDHSMQAYANISQAYRPMRFDDVANPNSNLSLVNDPDVAKALNTEIGVRGAPFTGLFVDVSVFRIDFNDKIETVTLSPTEVERVNSGDARHQGIELAAEYDFLAGRQGNSHLSLFGSASFLDAEITKSLNPALVGNTPSYAPDYVFKAGLIYRHGERLKLALSGAMVDDHYWQDSNTTGGTASNSIDAVVPAYQVFDLSAEWAINKHFTLLGGVNNLFDEAYYSRVRSDGIEPAAERMPYLGIEVGF